MRMLLALWMFVGLGILLPAHHHGWGMLRASAEIDVCHHHDHSHADSGEGDRPSQHDPAHCSICLVAGGLAAVQLVDVIVPPPQMAPQRQAFEPVEATPQQRPAPISERGPPLV